MKIGETKITKNAASYSRYLSTKRKKATRQLTNGFSNI